MDRRATPRHSVSPHAQSTVRVTLLSVDGAGDVAIEASVVDWSAAGLRVITARSVPPGTPVRVDWFDELALGEACYCAETSLGRFAVGLRLTQMLSGLEGLRRLSERLLGESRQPAESRLSVTSQV